MAISRATYKDLFAGRQLFEVGVYVKDGKLEAHLIEHTCASRPKIAGWSNLEQRAVMYVDTSRISYYTDRKIKDKCFLHDLNVTQNGYNLHQLFVKRKHAVKHMNRINAGCLTFAERKHLDKAAEMGKCH